MKKRKPKPLQRKSKPSKCKKAAGLRDQRPYVSFAPANPCRARMVVRERKILPPALIVVKPIPSKPVDILIPIAKLSDVSG